jgi:hypothetical protein
LDQKSAGRVTTDARFRDYAGGGLHQMPVVAGCRGLADRLSPQHALQVRQPVIAASHRRARDVAPALQARLHLAHQGALPLPDTRDYFGRGEAHMTLQVVQRAARLIAGAGHLARRYVRLRRRYWPVSERERLADQRPNSWR